MERVYTTGQIAKHCKVAPRTVSKWIDSGRLKGFRIPGSQDRRVSHEHLVRFLRGHGLPLGDLDELGKTKILLFGGEGDFLERLRAELSLQRGVLIAQSTNSFDSGIVCASLRPTLVVVDFKDDSLNRALFCKNLRQHTRFCSTPLLGLFGGSQEQLRINECTESFVSPFDIKLLAARIVTISKALQAA